MYTFFRMWWVTAILTFPLCSFAQDGAGTNGAEFGDEKVLEVVYVTGTRLQQTTFTSIAPLQVITAEGSHESGLFEAADILQNSNAVAGQQIDLTFTNQVLVNGPGASTIGLRGLGDIRTLVLLNGRRLAPSGVEGAPVAPDLNLVPAMLVRQYDVLLDGASSIYGSDAVAGVINIHLRNDFDGLEAGVYYNLPDQGEGDSYTANLVWGRNFERGFAGFGIEYRNSEPVALGDRDWTDGCSRHHEIDENGRFRSQEQFYTTVYGMAWDECRLGLLASRVNVPLAGYIYHTPGASNGGWPGFSESSAFGFGIDSNQDGIADLSFRDYDLNGKATDMNAHLYPDSERFSLMGYGEYTLDGEWNHTPFFELNYNSSDLFMDSGPAPLVQDVPANNPFNICNPNGIRGVDCGLAQDALYDNPGYRASFMDRFEQLCAAYGIPPASCVPETFGLYTGPIGPASSAPFVIIEGDRSTTSVKKRQYRFVGGFKGDIPLFNRGPMSNWVYDSAFSWTRSEGESHRGGIRADRLWLALGWFSETHTPCDFDANPYGMRLTGDTGAGCVPVDLFAPSLYPVPGVVGDLTTQAERDYLFDSRDFDTTYTQTLFTFYANGFLWDLPGGPLKAGLGIEWRRDDIDSIPDDLACNGLLWGYFADCGAEGDKDTSEIFGEVELPLLAERIGAEDLRLNLSVRWTDDELYGSGTTYSVKLGWNPVSSLLLRGTFGTSFRAPALREVFLRDQTSFGPATDPCFIPESAWNPVTGGYDPALDPRPSYVLENCYRTGVDPTALWDNGNTHFTVEMPVGGNAHLEAETSESFTAGFAFEQPWSEAFDLALGATYYQIDIDDAIIEPSAQYVINDCYYDEEQDSALCDRISRHEFDDTLSRIDAGFMNRDNEKVVGVDVNANYQQTFRIGAQTMGLGLDLSLNHTIERSTRLISDDGDVDIDQFEGEWGYPDWKGHLGIRLNLSDWRFTWAVNYIGATGEGTDAVDPWDDISGSSDTCFGPPDDVLCRDFNDLDDYWLHSISLYRYGEEWTVGLGVHNLFDEAPPIADGRLGMTVKNVPIGYGYDLMGRTFFCNVAWRFGR